MIVKFLEFNIHSIEVYHIIILKKMKRSDFFFAKFKEIKAFMSTHAKLR